jgi:hypothetical protein
MTDLAMKATETCACVWKPVVLDGLGKQEYNGLEGILGGYVAETGRCVFHPNDPDKKQLSVKPDNAFLLSEDGKVKSCIADPIFRPTNLAEVRDRVVEEYRSTKLSCRTEMMLPSSCLTDHPTVLTWKIIWESQLEQQHLFPFWVLASIMLSDNTWLTKRNRKHRRRTCEKSRVNITAYIQASWDTNCCSVHNVWRRVIARKNVR